MVGSENHRSIPGNILLAFDLDFSVIVEEEKLHIRVDPIVNPVSSVDALKCTPYPFFGHKA
jgi:hypothetical protein